MEGTGDKSYSIKEPKKVAKTLCPQVVPGWTSSVRTAGTALVRRSLVIGQARHALILSNKT